MADAAAGDDAEGWMIRGVVAARRGDTAGAVRWLALAEATATSPADNARACSTAAVTLAKSGGGYESLETAARAVARGLGHVDGCTADAGGSAAGCATISASSKSSLVCVRVTRPRSGGPATR